MIDEDLYQQAADELNSDRRRPALWARACALASDDHDEARFLYTNLRVEELLAEAKANGDNISNDSIVGQSLSDSTLALEPLDETAVEEEPIGFLQDDFKLSDADSELNDIPKSVSTPAGVDGQKNSDDFLSLDQLPSASIDVPKEDIRNDPDATLMEGYVPENHDALDDTYEGTAALADEDIAAAIASVSNENRVAQSPDDAFETDTDIPTLEPSVDLAQTPVKQNDEPGDLTQANMQVLDEHANELDDILENEQELPATASDDFIHDASLVDEVDELEQSAQFVDATVVMDNELEPVVYEEDPFAENLNRQADELGFVAPDDELTSMKNDFENQARGLEEPSSSPSASFEQENTSFEDDSDDFDSTKVAAELADFSAKHSSPDLSDDHIEPADLNDSVNVLGAGATAAVGAAVASTAAMASTTDSSNFDSTTDSTDTLPNNSELSDSERQTSASTELNLPLDLTEGRKGAEYSVYRRDIKAQAVKSGVSWSALFLTFPYLVYRQLFGTALAYAALWVISLGGLLISGLAWLDAGAAVTPLVQACTIGFALLAFIGLIYLPFRYGNTWRAEKLENRGFELVAIANAKSPGKAIARARRHAALLN